MPVGVAFEALSDTAQPASAIIRCCAKLNQIVTKCNDRQVRSLGESDCGVI